jgi:nicotinamide mononucleotide transporter
VDAALTVDLLQQAILQLRASPPLELSASLTGLGYAVLAVRRDRRAWVFGALSSAMLAWLAAGARLPLQAVLQSAYVLMAVHGFRNWSRAADARDARVRIDRWPIRSHLVAMLAVALGTLALAPALARWTDAASPHLDAATTLGSLFATWLTARAVFENWYWWLAVNIASFALYQSQGLALVSVLYLVYLVIAVIGLRAWSRQPATDTADPPAGDDAPRTDERGER